MAQPPPGHLWTPAAVHFVQHQFAQVTNFWRLGLPAEFHLVSNECGTAELKLTFPLGAPSDPIPPPSAPNTTASSSGSESLKKANKSRILRRERRAAERAVAEKNAAKNSAEVKTEEKKVDSEIAAAEKAVTEIAACTMKVVAEDFAKAAEKVQDYDIDKTTSGESEGSEGASTSRIPAPSSRSVDEGLVLPLCHYCCHRGSDMNPVHYEHMCICDDRDCSCGCYCTEAQLEHRKLHFPGVWSERYHERRAVMLLDRPKAMAVAEARIVKWNGNRPCWQPSCLLEN